MILNERGYKKNIKRIRNVGLGYRKIGIILDILWDKTRNYCKSNGVDRYAKNLLRTREGKQVETTRGDSVCRQCDKLVESN